MRTTMKAAAGIILLTGLGCGSPTDERFQKLATQSLQRQAEQNQVLARQSTRMADASRQLVEAEQRSQQQIIGLQREITARDAEARSDLNELTRQAQTEHSAAWDRLDRRRDMLDEESKNLAAKRQLGLLTGAALSVFGTSIACLLPLALAAYVVFVASRSSDEEILVGDLLVRQLAENPQPTLMHGPPTLSLDDRQGGMEPDQDQQTEGGEQ